ncbi:31001_t:CDS:2, partial [Gigaspora margarita]
PCQALLQLTQAQNASQTGDTIPAPVDNSAPASEGDLISFDKNLPTYQPAQPSIPAVNLLTDNIPEVEPEAGPVSKTDKEWFDLMESYISEPSNPKSQAYYFLDLDIEYAKDMFKVDRAEYAFSTWFINTEEHKLEAGMTEERAREILNAIDNSEYLIRVKFIRADTVISDKKTKRGFKIIDKYEPIRESKKASGKYVRVGIDEKFLVREVSRQSEVERLDSNTVVYGLYQIRKPDDGTLNCVAEQVIEHFDQAKRGHGLTKICRQKINNWEKKMRIPGARVQDVAELEKILKRPITLLDITHGTIFNSKKYQLGKYEEIEMVVHNGHAFSQNQHFPKDRMVEYYKGDTWEAINNALQGPQAIWLIGVGDGTQRISQFVLEDGRTFRTWKKHIEIIEACKQLVNDAINWQYQENIINEEKRSILLESLKVVDLAEQRACVEHGHGGRWNTPNYHINDIICIDMKECYPASMRGQRECATWFNRFGHPIHHLVRVAVNGKLPKDDITGFAQVRSFKFAPNIHPVIPVWYGKHFACREDLTVGEVIISLTKQTKVWLPNNQDISCAIIDKFIQGSKIDKKRLTHRLVTDEGELDFLIKDCTDAGTFAASMLAYAHINLFEMLRRFEPNEVVRIATDSIYIRKEALYKIKNVPAFFKQEKAKDLDLCPHTYPLCAMCTDSEEFFISKSEYAKWIKEFLKMKMPLEIQPDQWHDKGEKIYGPDANIVYWPKNRHWESIKDITKSTTLLIYDPITKFQVSYLNGGEGSGKTTRAIRIFKDINMV